MTKFQFPNNFQISNIKKLGLWCLVLGIYLVLCLWCLAIPAKAQTLSLSLYPPLLEVMIQPGKTITQVYKLTNQGEVDLAMASKVISFEPADELGNINLVSSSELPISSWFSFQNADLALGDKFLLKAGQEQEVVLKIKIPEKAREDDYYLALLFETLPEVLMGNQSATQAQAKIGANVLITVSQSGKPIKKAEIVEFSLQSSVFGLPIIDSFDKPQFKLRVKNTGQAFFKPVGKIETTGWLGQKFSLDLLPENVLLNSSRQIRCQVNEEPGLCQLTNTRFLLGPYQAKVEFGLDEVAADYFTETTFLVLPWKLFLGTLTAVFSLILIKSRFNA
jgi:hypothetical protein